MQDEWNASEAQELANQQGFSRTFLEEPNGFELQQRTVPFQTTREEWPRLSWDRGTSQRIPAVPGSWSSSSPGSIIYVLAIDEDQDQLSTSIAGWRHGRAHWDVDAQKSMGAAQNDEDEIRNYDREQHECAEQASREPVQARKEDVRRQEVAERERRARQAECAACGEVADKSDMAVLERFNALAGGKTFSYCGKVRVPVDVAARFRSSTFVATYRNKALELDTPNPIYCSVPGCSAFIPPSSTKGDMATCPKCGFITRKLCKNPEHEGV